MRSGYKDNLATTDVKTSRKNQFMSSSPYGSNDKGRLSNLKFRSPLREQQVQDYNRIKTQLKREISMAKENFSLNQSGQWVTMQEYMALRQQTKYESERLLYQIQKLHEEIYDLERRKNLQIEKIREQYEQNTYLNMSQIRQGHSSQVELLETQLRKTKELMNDKTAENETLMKRQEREIKQLTNENNRLNEEVRNLIKQKNSQVESQMKLNEQKISSIRKQHEELIKELRVSHDRQISKLNSLLEVKENRITYEQKNITTLQSKCEQLQLTVQSNSYQSVQERQQLQEQLKLKYNQLKQSLQQQNQSIIESINNNYQIKQQILLNEITQLKTFLTTKNQDRQKLIQLYEQRLSFSQQQFKQLQTQNQQLKHKLTSIQSHNMQQLQILKVKISSLHQNNIKTLIETYKQQISNLTNQILTHQSTIQRLTKNLYQQTNHRYQMRKKYSIELSQLNQKIIKLRSGITHIQNDFKQKLQNQKSILLLTSRNLIKDLSTKQIDAKTTQIELHKIQLLYEENYKQLQTSNQIIDEKVKIAQQELHRLTSHVMEQKKRHIETQNTYKAILQNKNQQIQKLQTQLNNITHPQFDNSKQLQLIDQLKSQLHQKKLQNAQLKDQCQLLEKKISIMKAQIDQYHLEQQITQQEAKKQFQRISQQNMDQFLKFYQARINTLEQQKNDLKQLISSKQEKITSLVQKYQELQKTMKETLAKIKKRTQLETKVIALGTDNNLVKNMAEIVRNNLENKP